VFYARPAWIAFSIGGFLLGLGIRYAKSNWSQVTSILKRFLITTAVVGVGLFPLLRFIDRRQTVLIIMAACIIGWTVLPGKVRVAARSWATVLLAILWAA